MSYTNQKLIEREDAILSYHISALNLIEKGIKEKKEPKLVELGDRFCPNCGPRCMQNAQGRIIRDTDCSNCEYCGTETK